MSLHTDGPSEGAWLGPCTPLKEHPQSAAIMLAARVNVVPFGLNFAVFLDICFPISKINPGAGRNAFVGPQGGPR